MGCRPGAPFQYKIPATGVRPLTYEVTGLPSSLHLDGTTFQTAMSNGIPSKITIPDQDVQEIRIGYRYEIN